MLHRDAVEFGEEGEVAVHEEPFAVALPLGVHQARFLEAVEFHAQGVGILAELLLQAAQIAPLLRVQEEPGEEADAGAGLDEGVEQNGERLTVNG